MKLDESQPAISYDLNILNSALGRCQVDNLDEKDKLDINSLVEATLNLLKLDKALLPHTDPQIIDKFLTTIRRILDILNFQTVKLILDPSLLLDLIKQLNILNDKAYKLLGTQKVSLSLSEEIAKMFGFNDMWDIALNEADSALLEFDEYRHHPNMPEVLQEPVDLEETRRLIKYVIEKFFELEMPKNLNISIKKNLRGYHLFWSIINNGIDYVTPLQYDLATQLSFDIPHNAAHIVHLSALNLCGLTAYYDDMAHRSYFESVAVLSEHQIIDLLKKESQIPSEIKNLLDPKRIISSENLRQWILADRVYEARLRVARLLADFFTIEGLSFDQTVLEVALRVGLPHKKAYNETLKYYSLTGLGAVYTLGPNKLKNHGVTNPKNAIYSKNNIVITTWDEFMQLRL